MNRRSFFGFAGGAAVAAPSLPKTITDLELPGITDIPTSGYFYDNDELDPNSRKHYTKVLKRILGMTKEQREAQRKRFVVRNLDVNVATLRSVSLGTKIRMSRNVQFEKDLIRKKDHAEGLLSGLLVGDEY